jgi:hypothetical protein
VRLPGCRAPGLDGEQLRIQGNLELNKGFTAEGEVRLLGAHIGGQLGWSVLLQAPSGLDHPIRDEVYRVRSLGAFNQPDQPFSQLGCRPHGGALGRTAVGDHIPFDTVQRHDG